jgi:type II secretory pathway pseudopilin PulG
VITIIGIAAFFAAATYTLRRRKRNLLDQEEFLDKYPDSPSQQGHGVGIDNVDQHDVIRPAAPDAYPDRQIHFGGDKHPYSSGSYATQQGYASDAHSQQQYASTQQQYASAQQQPAPIQQQYAPNQPLDTQYAQHAQQDPGFEYPPGTAYSSDDQYPYDNEAAYGGATPIRASLVQPAYRQTGGRGSYQPSIDSFYGAPVAR